MPTELSKIHEIERLLKMKKLQTERTLRHILDRRARLNKEAHLAQNHSRTLLDEVNSHQVQAFNHWKESQAQRAEIYWAEIATMQPDIEALREATRRVTRQLIAVEEIMSDLQIRESLAQEEAEEMRREAITQLNSLI